MKPLSFISTLLGMHLIGNAILFGIVSGPIAIFASPILGIFGLYMLIPEGIILGLMRSFHDSLPARRSSVWIQGMVWVLISGIIASLLTPKEQNCEKLFWLTGFLGGTGSGAFAFVLTHLQKRFEQHPLTESLSSIRSG